MRIVQRGDGDKRPLVICYYVGMMMDDALRAVVTPNAAIINETFAVPKGHYSTGGKYASFGYLRPLPEVLCEHEAKLGATDFDPVVLIGFSEGCGGLRTQLSAGHYPSATIAIDGIHSGLKSAASWQIEPWRTWFERCGADLEAGAKDAPPAPGKPIAIATYSQIIPPTFASSRKTLERITGWTLPTDNTPGWGYLRRSGNLTIVGYWGNDAPAHIRQQREILPQMLANCARELGFASAFQGLPAPLPPIHVARACPTPQPGNVPVPPVTPEPPKVHRPWPFRRIAPALGWAAAAGLLGYLTRPTYG